MEAITEGHYYRKQLGCKSGIIAWSHGARFKRALDLIGPSVRTILDYGSGDGTFLAMAAPSLSLGWGADLATDQIKDCQARFAALTNLRFSTIPELADPAHTAAYEVVTCMETLEHCTSPIVDVVLSDLSRLVTKDGRVIISVPIEIGPTFPIKALVRRLAAWRGLSDYRTYESYSLRNAARMVFATRSTAIDRPVYGDRQSPYHSHYGFNWRAMRERVRTYLDIEKTQFSPLGWSGGWLSSQAWFVCRPRSR